MRNHRELLTLSAVYTLQAVLQDIQAVMDALDENVEMFAHDQRNFGAQQAMILSDQKSWSGWTATEKVFWMVDNSVELVGRSADWVARTELELCRFSGVVVDPFVICCSYMCTYVRACWPCLGLVLPKAL